MPWSLWVVAAVVVAAMIPQVAQVVAFFLLLAGAAIVALLFRPSGSNASLVSALAEKTGVNSLYMDLGIAGTLIFIIGLVFLIAGTRGRREPVFFHAGILTLGLLLASVIALYRMPSTFGN